MSNLIFIGHFIILCWNMCVFSLFLTKNQKNFSFFRNFFHKISFFYKNMSFFMSFRVSATNEKSIFHSLDFSLQSKWHTTRHFEWVQRTRNPPFIHWISPFGRNDPLLSFRVSTTNEKSTFHSLDFSPFAPLRVEMTPSCHFEEPRDEKSIFYSLDFSLRSK